MDSKSEKSHTPSFADFLKKRGMVGLEKESELIEKTIKASRMKNLVPAFLIRGSPGTGKTTVAELYSEYINAKKFFIQLTPSSDENDIIYNIIPDSSTPSGFKLVEGVLIKALRESHRNDVVIILDEIDKTRPKFDAFLLDFLQNCRVSTNINDEIAIHGNKSRITVFMTSNDIREFSEALLRRVVQIRLQLLPTIEIYKLMLKEFNDERIAAVLAQIYDDTINANLSKPATIQELKLAGELLKNGIDLETVIVTTIIKTDDDMKKYTEYIKNRKSYQWMENNINNDSNNNSDDDLADYYDYHNDDKVFINNNKYNKKERKGLNRIKVPSLVIDKKTDVLNEEKTVSMIADNDDDQAYTAIAKLSSAKPTDDPNTIVGEGGRFKVVRDGETMKEFVIREEPLTIKELRELANNRVEGSFYVEDSVIMCSIQSDDIIKELIDDADRVKYYTRNKIAMIRNTFDSEIKVVLTIERRSDKCIDGRIQLRIDGSAYALYFLNEYIVYEKVHGDYRDAEVVLAIANELKKIGYSTDVKISKQCDHDVCAEININDKKITIIVGQKLADKLSRIENPEEKVFRARYRNVEWVVE